MKNGNVHQFAQPFFDHEAVGRLDVFQIDAAECRAKIAHAVDESLDIMRVDFDVDGIHIGEALEQHGLAFHHRLGGERAQIAQPQDRGAVGDHGHEIALGGIVVDGVRVLRDGAHGRGHAGGIGEAQVALGRHRLGGDDGELAGLTLRVEGQGLFVGEGRSLNRVHA